MDLLQIVLFLIAIATIAAVPLDDSAPTDGSTTPAVTVGNSTENATLSTNCTTARNVSGTCVQRSACDYSTPAIDLSLYVPSWYNSICSSDEVCCPFSYLVPENPKYENYSNVNGIESNDSDGDDDFWNK